MQHLCVHTQNLYCSNRGAPVIHYDFSGVWELIRKSLIVPVHRRIITRPRRWKMGPRRSDWSLISLEITLYSTALTALTALTGDAPLWAPL